MNKALFVMSLLAIATIFGNITNGCATKPVQKVIQGEGILITSVDTGMKIWADYVNAHLTDGKVTQKQLDTVKEAYNAYYASQMTAKAVIEKILSNVSTNQADALTANLAVKNAEAELLNLLNSYIK
jgi:hypothetical protein